MKRGVYLVTEQGCMRPTTGAFRHITIGREELSKYYDIHLIAPPAPQSSRPSQKNSNGQVNKKKPGPFRGMLKDIKTLLINHSKLISLYRKIKKAQPEFIYERISYLNFNGLIIAKLLGIKHFYELNGIPHYAIKKYYPSYFNKVVKKMEEVAFVKSDFMFFVGSWNQIVKLKRKNWVSIENGIENDYLEHFRDFNKAIGGEKINLVFIAHLMHTNKVYDVLTNAFRDIPNKELFRLHLIGDQMDDLTAFCKKNNIDLVDHGFMNRAGLLKILEQMHIGIIPGGEEYQSFMKIFEYGISKCLVIAPDLFNMKYWFSDKDILFFKKYDAADFQRCVTQAVTDQALISRYGAHIYETIRTNFTWPKIFSQIQTVIAEKIQ